jgi:guanylate kinase
MLVIVSGPSGVGKDTVIDALRRLPDGDSRHYVVTCTTRPRRPYEVDGIHYQFLDEASFRALHDAGGLLEANDVHGNWYGTPRRQVREALVAGRDVILKIDVQGAAEVKQKVPEALLVFLVPPSLEDLFVRLQSRATESADELDIRQRNAALELAHQEDYDHVVVNETGQVERTAARIDEIIRGEKAAHPDRRTRV